MKIVSVIGARPDFMKIASIIRAIDKHNKSVRSSNGILHFLLVHTEQHYDYEMSRIFF